MASAGFPNTALQIWVWMDMRAGRNFISRFGAFEVDSVLQMFSSRTLIPILYPNVFSLNIRGDKSRNKSGEERRLPPFKIIDPAHPLLSVLDNFGEEVGERRCRDLRNTRLVEMPIVDVWPEIWSWSTESCVD